MQNGGLVTSGNTSVLNAGDCGFYDAKTWNAIPLGQASVSQHPRVVFVMGGYRAGLEIDTVGNYGGYAETIKSKVIEPLRVHRFWKVPAGFARAHIVQVGWDGSDDATIPKFYCGQNYQLRIDLKGSPALRALHHNVHYIFDVKTACCRNNPPELVDPVAVFLAFAKQINENPIVSKFFTASVFNGDVLPVDPDTYVPLTDPGDIVFSTPSLKLTGGYDYTRFTFCSFDPRDYFEVEPVVITSVQLVDNTDDPCSSFKQLTFKELQAGKGPQGSGDQILREFLLDNEYRQEPFPWDSRMRDIYNFDAMPAVVNQGLYDSIYVLFDSPRRYNPSGTYDNDVYLLRVCAPVGGNMLDDFEAWFTAYLNSAGGVKLEVMT